MINLPNDIIEKVKNDFKEENWDIIFEELGQVLKDSINVGHIQLIRSIISLSEGNRYKLMNLRTNRYMGDPRDVINMANNINQKSDSGRRPFEIGKFKSGWISEYWTTDRNLTKQEIKNIDKWIYNNIFTNDQFDIKPKTESKVNVFQYNELKGETFGEMIQLNNPITKLPKNQKFEAEIYSALKKSNKRTCCYTFTFSQSNTYKYDRGILGEYEFENSKTNEIGNGLLYPLYTNLFNEDIENEFKNNYALGTGLLGKDFDWYILIHFKNEKAMYIETLIGGELKIISKK